MPPRTIPRGAKWQDTADLGIRQQMIKHIIHLLRTKKPDAREEWLKKLPDMAKKLEDKLFHQSTSQENYNNRDTLTRRLQTIALQITNDRTQQRLQQQRRESPMPMRESPMPSNPNGHAQPHMRFPDRRPSNVRSVAGTPNHMFPPHATAPQHPPRQVAHNSLRQIPHHPQSQSPIPGGLLVRERGAASEESKNTVLKQQQHRLLLLRHASRCQFGQGKCAATKHCEAYKRLWVHIANCRNQQCETPHCVSSRYVLAHYHRCQEVHCAVCRPVRDAISKQNQMKMQQQQQQQGRRINSRQRLPSIGPTSSSTHPYMPNQTPTPRNQSPYPYPNNQGMPHPRQAPIQNTPSFNRAGEERSYLAPDLQTTTAPKTDIEQRIAELEERRKAIAEKKKKEAAEEETLRRDIQMLREMKKTGVQPNLNQVANPQMMQSRSSGMPFQQNMTPTRANLQSDPRIAKRMAGVTHPGQQRPTPIQGQVQSPANAVAVRKQRLIKSLTSMQNQTSLVYTFDIKDIEKHVKSLSYLSASSTSIHLKPTELKIKATSLLKILTEEEFSWIFNKPVDPDDLGIPDYFEVVRRPMDLGTVKKRIDTNFYKCLKDFAQDVRLVFNNAMLYNPSGGDVHNISRQYGFKFENAYNKLLRDMKREGANKRKNENACRLCGGEKYTFEPPVYYCSGKCNQKIRRGAFYYVTPDNKQFYCLTCHNSVLRELIVLEDGTEVTKSKLKKKKNDEVQEESWVECNMCKKWYHQICVLFNSRRNDQSRNEPFYCPVCVLRYIEQLRTDRLPQKEDVKFSAKDLPQTGYSDFLEMRIKRRVLAARKQYAKSRKVPLAVVEECDDITIRVVSCKDIDLHPRAGLERLYGESHNYPKLFNHRVKCILLFKKVDGVDVLILSLYTQVYGSETSAPNARTLYIAYLDSVNFFTPSYCRTPVYKELLESTLEFEKKRGITKTFIWVCPPLAGDDYILYCHPKDQKTPKAEMLRNWYFSLLEDSRKKGVIVSIDNLYDAYFQRMCCVTSVPNFDGDYWPGVTEQFIEQLESEKIDPKSIAPRKKRTFSRNKQLEKGGKKRNKSKGKKQNKTKKKNKAKSKLKAKQEKIPDPPVKIESTDQLEETDKIEILTEAEKEITAASFIPPKPLPCLEVPQQDALTVKISEVIQQMKDDFMVVYMHHICSSCCSDIDKPNQLYWLPEKYDAAAIDLDYTKKRYAPPYALCDECYKEKWKEEYPDIEPSYDGIENEKLSKFEKDLENVKGFGTSNDSSEADQIINNAVKEVMNKLCEKVETETVMHIDEEDEFFKVQNEDEEKKLEEEVSVKPVVEEKKETVEEISVTQEDKVEDAKTEQPTDGLTVLVAMAEVKEDAEKVAASPKSVAGAPEMPEEVITVLPEGQNANRRSAWVNPPCNLLQMKPFRTQVPEKTVDTDPIVENQFFDTRQQFLSLCQGNRYQFDQLRRAKHTSMMVLYHLHNPDLPMFIHSCNSCKADIAQGERYTCKECDDFDLCESCARRLSHPHPLYCVNDPTNSKVINPGRGMAYPSTAMGRKAAGVRGGYAPGYFQQNRNMVHGYQGQTRSNPKKVQAHMALLVHASNCQEQNCGNKHCSRMRQLLKHGANCKTRVRGQCKICKRIWGLLHLHSRQCRVKGSCNVPGCNKLRAHLRRMVQSQDRRIMMQTQRMQEERMQAQTMPIQRSPLPTDQTGFGPSSPALHVQRNAKHGKNLR